MAVTFSNRRPMGRVLPGTVPTSQRLTEGGSGFDPDEPPNTATGSGTTGTGTGGISTIVLDTSGGQGGYYSYLAQLEKIKADQAAAAAASQRATQGALGQAGYLTGLLNQGVPENIANLISGQQTGGQDYITKQYELLANQLRGSYVPETNVGTGYLGAQGRTTAGFNALQEYLRRNQPQAFAQAQRAQAAPMTSDVMQYLAGQGVSGAPVQAQVDVANLAAQGGATNYNQLLNTLQAAQAAAQESRMAEEQMARSAALSGLEGLYQSQAGGLQQEQLSALAALQANIANQRIAAETAAAARNQAIQDALGSLIGTGYFTPNQITPTTITGTTPDTVITTTQPTIVPTPTAKPTPVQQLAAKLAGIKNESLANRVENFVASNPNATPAQIKKQFPSLGANITR